MPDTRYQRTVWARRGWPACGPSRFPMQTAPTTGSGCDQHGQHHPAGPREPGVCQVPGVPEAAMEELSFSSCAA